MLSGVQDRDRRGAPPPQGRREAHRAYRGQGAADKRSPTGSEPQGADHLLNGAIDLWHEACEDGHCFEHDGRPAEGHCGQAPHPWRHQHADCRRPRPRKVAVPEVHRADLPPCGLHHGQGRQRRRSHRRGHQGRERGLGPRGRGHGLGGRWHVPHRRVRQDERQRPHVVARGHGTADYLGVQGRHRRDIEGSLLRRGGGEPIGGQVRPPADIRPEREPNGPHPQPLRHPRRPPRRVRPRAGRAPRGPRALQPHPLAPRRERRRQGRAAEARAVGEPRRAARPGTAEVLYHLCAAEDPPQDRRHRQG
mmetsp:Transcript_74411/g.215671  ORF Transcript_74411/g.215671 Transcript_74411/m.215671 type:complete len:306 (-) Transcript_74411:697-1614(-)